jgi:hypothetical protein
MARKKANIHYLYKTTCLITNRYYIGMHSTYNLNDGYMGSGKRLRYSLRKHGVDNHDKEILEFFETRELLIEAEKKAITSEMVVDNNCMNLKSGGDGGFISEEQQRHRSQCGGKAYAKKLKSDLDVRKKHSIISSETLKKTHKAGKIKYNTFTGKTHSDKTKNKMSESSKGKGLGVTNSQYGTCWITKDGENNKIKKEDLNLFIQDGWIQGRKI